MQHNSLKVLSQLKRTLHFDNERSAKKRILPPLLILILIKFLLAKLFMYVMLSPDQDIFNLFMGNFFFHFESNT